MRVLVSPRCREGAVAGSAMTVARALAGPDGETVVLEGLGARAFRRSLSAAEIHIIRTAILGVDAAASAQTDAGPPPVVGYVCAGMAVAPLDEGTVVAVSDHVNLAWRSPLAGPNDERLGPRFPSMAGVYAPATVADGLAREGIGRVRLGVVAGVRDDEGHLAFEKAIALDRDMIAVSSELVPVAILAAHLGVRLAAAVTIVGRA